MARYRDSKTGRYVAQATWKRSKSHGGTRYRRETTKASEPKDEITSVQQYADEYRDYPEDFDSEYEFEGNADYATENQD